MTDEEELEDGRAFLKEKTMWDSMVV